jgi:8-oxo-dGTP pyrophosphatase MutT (NUDIX family)
MHSTDLTIGAVIEKDGRYLLVEEFSQGAAVINQPGGHIEAGESPEDAVLREVLEETGCRVVCGDLIGVYLFVHPQSCQQFLRIVYVAEYLDCDENRSLDDGIIERRWMSREEVEEHQRVLRTPVVLRCILDYEAGRRASDKLLFGMLPLQNNVEAVLANADIV